MKARRGLVTLMLAALTGCGGGTVSVGVGEFSTDHPFIIWHGNSNGDEVVDANNDGFAFFADNGCLYNFQTDRENRSFCLTSEGDIAVYGGLRMQIANVRSVTGVCIAALLDEATGHFIDIGLDAVGREVVFITDLHPDFCFV
jgi:hypothetical protein